MKRYVLLPLSATPLILVATFTVCLLLAWRAGFAGIPLALIIFSWFFKYCFVMLDALVSGQDELPVLSVEMVNPVDEQRPLALLLLLAAQAWLVFAAHSYVGHTAAAVTAALCLFALPGQIAILGVTRSAWRAIWPPEWIMLARHLGMAYVGLVAAVILAAIAIYALPRFDLPLSILLASGQLAFLLLAGLIGGTLFEHRHALGIETRTREERLAERAQREHDAERAKMLDQAYASFRVQRPLDGWRDLEAWLDRWAQGDTRVAEYRALLAAASTWADLRPADKLANDLIALLLARRETGEALDVVEQRLQSNPGFELAQPALAVRLAELAQLAGKRSLQRLLSSRYGERAGGRMQ